MQRDTRVPPEGRHDGLQRAAGEVRHGRADTRDGGVHGSRGWAGLVELDHAEVDLGGDGMLACRGGLVADLPVPVDELAAAPAERVMRCQRGEASRLRGVLGELEALTDQVRQGPGRVRARRGAWLRRGARGTARADAVGRAAAGQDEHSRAREGDACAGNACAGNTAHERGAPAVLV